MAKTKTLLKTTYMWESGFKGYRQVKNTPAVFKDFPFVIFSFLLTF